MAGTREFRSKKDDDSRFNNQTVGHEIFEELVFFPLNITAIYGMDGQLLSPNAQKKLLAYLTFITNLRGNYPLSIPKTSLDLKKHRVPTNQLSGKDIAKISKHYVKIINGDMEASPQEIIVAKLELLSICCAAFCSINITDQVLTAEDLFPALNLFFPESFNLAQPTSLSDAAKMVLNSSLRHLNSTANSSPPNSPSFSTISPRIVNKTKKKVSLLSRLKNFFKPRQKKGSPVSLTLSSHHQMSSSIPVPNPAKVYLEITKSENVLAKRSAYQHELKNIFKELFPNQNIDEIFSQELAPKEKINTYFLTSSYTQILTICLNEILNPSNLMFSFPREKNAFQNNKNALRLNNQLIQTVNKYGDKKSKKKLVEFYLNQLAVHQNNFKYANFLIQQIHRLSNKKLLNPTKEAIFIVQQNLQQYLQFSEACEDKRQFVAHLQNPLEYNSSFLIQHYMSLLVIYQNNSSIANFLIEQLDVFRNYQLMTEWEQLELITHKNMLNYLHLPLRNSEKRHIAQSVNLEANIINSSSKTPSEKIIALKTLALEKQQVIKEKKSGSVSGFLNSFFGRKPVSQLDEKLEDIKKTADAALTSLAEQADSPRTRSRRMRK